VFSLLLHNLDLALPNQADDNHNDNDGPIAIAIGHTIGKQG
jgi:hypothetical protein